MLELMENSKKEIQEIEDGMLKNATNKISYYHTIAKNALLGISLVLADIANKPKEYLENSHFETIADYAEKVFGYKKSYTYKLIKISKFIKIKDKDNNLISISDIIDDKICYYTFEAIADSDGFEYSPSQMLELIPLTKEQIEDNIKTLDSSLTCKELRSIVKDIISPPIEVKGEEVKGEEVKGEEQEDENKQEEKPLTDKDRILQMLEICSGMENESIKEKIVNVFQKSLKALEK